MANIEEAIRRTLVHEGGFQNDPQDHANWSSGVIGQGELLGTKYGITALDMPGVNIRDITPEQATEFYREHYWKPLYSQITSELVAEKLFDLGVLFGVHTAVAVMQTTLKTSFPMDVDGLFGPNTLSAIEQSDDTSLLAAYKTNMVTHAFNVATAKPEERKYLKGWSSRINCSDETPCPTCQS